MVQSRGLRPAAALAMGQLGTELRVWSRVLELGYRSAKGHRSIGSFPLAVSRRFPGRLQPFQSELSLGDHCRYQRWRITERKLWQDLWRQRQSHRPARLEVHVLR